MSYEIKNIKLAKQGDARIKWAAQSMPVVSDIAKEFATKKPLRGVKIAACLHITKETANLLLALKAGGAQVSACGSNPLSTQDDVAASLAKAGISIFAKHGQNNKDYYRALNKCLDIKPHITIDDGADLITAIHTKRKELLKYVGVGLEETTTGVIRLKAMAKASALKYPVIAVNDTPTKNLFDNVYGTGQSTLDAIMRATNLLIAGKTIVVAGYGNCGKGIAMRARGLGAKVIVTEIDAVKALQASMEGFSVAKMDDAARVGNIFITATGNKHIITKKHFQKMKDGAVVCNSGHFNVEISLPDLKKLANKKTRINADIEEYVLGNGKKIYLLSEGRLVNLAAAEGHPSSVMDMSFANQALTCAWLVKHYKTLIVDVHNVPEAIDKQVAARKLRSLELTIDILTPEQKRYLSSWGEGT